MNRGGENDKLVRFSSQSIHSMGYQPLTKRLQVQFKDEEVVYIYDNVPEEEWYAMKRAIYLDQYFNSVIAGHYPVSKRNNRRET